MNRIRSKTVKTVIRIYGHLFLNGINPIENMRIKRFPNRFNDLWRNKNDLL